MELGKGEEGGGGQPKHPGGGGLPQGEVFYEENMVPLVGEGVSVFDPTTNGDVVEVSTESMLNAENVARLPTIKHRATDGLDTSGLFPSHHRPKYSQLRVEFCLC